MKKPKTDKVAMVVGLEQHWTAGRPSGSKTFGLRDKPGRNLWPGEDVMSETH